MASKTSVRVKASEHPADVQACVRRSMELQGTKAPVVMVGDAMVDVTVLVRPLGKAQECYAVERYAEVERFCQPGGMLLVQEFFYQLTGSIPAVLGFSGDYAIKTRFVHNQAKQQLVMRLDDDPSAAKSDLRQRKQLVDFSNGLKREAPALGECPGLVVVDYGKQYCDQDVPALAVRQTQFGWAVIESKDPKVVRSVLAVLPMDSFAVVKMNYHEAITRFGVEPNSGDFPAHVARQVDETLGGGNASSHHRMVLVTLGEHGAVALYRRPDRGGEILTCPAVRNESVRALDFVGAGDAVTAAIAARCLKDYGRNGDVRSLIRNCLTDGVAAGTIRVSRGRNEVTGHAVRRGSISLSSLIKSVPL